MIREDMPKKIVTTKVTVWRQSKKGGELGWEKTTATRVETGSEPYSNTSITYDEQYRLPEKDYSPKCDVCLAQLEGYGCPSEIANPGYYETEGGCMDCRFRCQGSPIHIGIRNYCEKHIGIYNKKLGVGVAKPVPIGG